MNWEQQFQEEEEEEEKKTIIVDRLCIESGMEKGPGHSYVVFGGDDSKASIDLGMNVADTSAAQFCWGSVP